MSFQIDDTIVAIASPRGSGARGIVRLSGPQVVDCLQRCFRPDHEGAGEEEGGGGDCGTADWGTADWGTADWGTADWGTADWGTADWGTADWGTADWGRCRTPRVIAGRLPLVGTRVVLSVQLHLWPTRQSYTRQPSAELHTVSSPPLLEAAVQTLCAAGARLAAPGEFTQRAFLAGRLDLAQVEAVLGVIDATNQRELDAALRQLAGGLSQPLQRLRDDLLNLLADLEAGLDFVEEEIEFVTKEELDNRLVAARDVVKRLLNQISGRVLGNELPRVVLVGSPNVGKSSLWNSLLGDAAAIVSPKVGTTRDFLSQSLEIDGFACQLVDTAGRQTLGASSGFGPLDPVSDAAHTMTEWQSEGAQLRIYCLDGTRPLASDERQRLAGREQDSSLVVVTKWDLPSQLVGELVAANIEYFVTSSATGQGVDELRRAIRQHFVLASHETFVGSTAVRCRESLRMAAESLDRAHGIVTADAGDELLAEELRVALDELGKIVGAVYTEDLLDRIFSRFCIGK